MIINNWAPDIGIASCIISDKTSNITGYGSATCHEEDRPFMSELVGSYIAECRARIDILKKKRDYDLKPGLMSLNHLLSTMVHSDKYNPDSYESKRLNKEIQNTQKEIDYLNELIQEEKESLRQYLQHRNEIYDTLRKGQN